ncbi:MAG TPA: ABC transporter ATP-binding protein [Gammaproteobacteria bacterium]|nr:ABC transporter ATP-binding protein [Gammaproteobacteria bacterium]
MLLAPLVGSLYPFAYNFAIKLFLDAMDEPTSLTYTKLLFPIGLFLATQILLDIVWRISDIAAWKSEPYVKRSILLRTYDYVQHHSSHFFQDNFSGAVSGKIDGILDGYEKFWEEMHQGLLSRALKIVVNLSALLIISHILGSFVIIWALIYIPTLYILSKRLNYFSFQETESRYTLIGAISDKITNITSLFSFSARSRELARLNDLVNHDYIPKEISLYKYSFKIQIVTGLLYWAMFFFTLFFMIYLKIHNLVSIGDFAFVFGITLVIAEDIWEATNSLQKFSRSMGDFKSSLSILETPQENLDSPQAKPLMVTKPLIEFKNVEFSYEADHIIFKNLNFTIHPGEKVGIVGHSGSGKSTIVNMLLRYFRINSGAILIDNQDINEVTQDSLREYIAVIPQDTSLFHRTLMENIRFSKPNATDEEVFDACHKAHIDEYIRTLPLQYETTVGERGVKLSGGQRQRIAIARAMLKNAPILILDEATSALDSQTEALIQDSLNLLIEDQSKTVIAIAHRLFTLKHMDRIIVLDKGKIVEEGTHDELIAKETSLYKNLWESQEI